MTRLTEWLAAHFSCTEMLTYKQNWSQNRTEQVVAVKPIPQIACGESILEYKLTHKRGPHIRTRRFIVYFVFSLNKFYPAPQLNFG